MRCSICGLGHHVGKAEAILRVNYRTENSCGYFESKGVNGELSNDACILLNLISSNVCECTPEDHGTLISDYPMSMNSKNILRRRKTDFKSTQISTSSLRPHSHDFAFTAVAQGKVSLDRRSIAPTLYGNVSHGRRLVGFRDLYILFVFFSVMLCLCIGIRCLFVSNVSNSRLSQAAQRNGQNPESAVGARGSISPEQESGITPTLLPSAGPTPNPQDQIRPNTFNKDKRRLVLQHLLPMQYNEQQLSEGPSTELTPGNEPVTKDDASSHNDLHARECSICLEAIGDNIIVGICSHTYHYDCIMEWLEYNHDECPNCRQLLWDPVTYKLVEESISISE